jgi:phosphopantothenoylcysteine decarboxylase/phosphopantothenate--cysteine ligase
LRILVTAGPTREYFDTVRFVSNPSTGKMGYALAAAAKKRGHHVVLVSGPVAIQPPRGIETVQVTTAAEMAVAAKRAFRQADAAVLTAAVCDYRPHRQLRHKLKKQPRTRPILLEPTEDIAASLGRRKAKRLIIGFAMEDRDHRANAEKKLVKKHCDAIVLNGPENVGADRAVIQILTADGRWHPETKGTKTQLADKIIKLLEQIKSNK